MARTKADIAPEALPMDHFCGRRRVILLAGLISVLASFAYLGLGWKELTPSSGGWTLLQDFFAASLTPAAIHQAPNLPVDHTPLLVQAIFAAILSLMVALAAMSLAVFWAFPVALVLSRTRQTCRPIARVISGSCTIFRSVHELIWAAILMVIFGFSALTAILAIALPYSGILTKLYSEILDSVPADDRLALEASGAGALSAFICSTVPRAIQELVSYTLYQLECAVRASAVMGFFGLPTLGFYILRSHENLYYNEVWTYLYVLILLLLAVESFSAAIRRRLT